MLFSGRSIVSSLAMASLAAAPLGAQVAAASGANVSSAPGTIIMVGGAVVGLDGLYKFLE